MKDLVTTILKHPKCLGLRRSGAKGFPPLSDEQTIKDVMKTQEEELTQYVREIINTPATQRNPSPTKLARKKCLDCSEGTIAVVTYCQITDCPLWTLRFGKPPKSVKDQNLLDPDKMPHHSLTPAQCKDYWDREGWNDPDFKPCDYA